LLVFVASLAPAFAQKRNITEKDLWDFVWIGDPQVSPDGSRVAFVRVTVNEKKEGYDTSIWSVPAAGGEETASTNEGRSRFDATLVAGRKISPFLARDGEGRKARGAAIVDLADGGWRLVFVYRFAQRRR